MNIIKVAGENKDFVYLCERLEDFQYALIPILKEKGYNLTDDLQEVTGFVLYINNKPVGSVGLKKVSDEVCKIVRVYVCDEHRGNGYAGVLFDKIETLAKELGYKRAEIEAWCDAKSALRFYKKMGYTCSEEKISEWFGGYKYVELFKNF